MSSQNEVAHVEIEAAESDPPAEKQGTGKPKKPTKPKDVKHKGFYGQHGEAALRLLNELFGAVSCERPWNPNNDEMTEEIVSFIGECRDAHGYIQGVLASALAKIVDPKQDIRLYKTEFSGGYNARSFDEKIVVPFLVEKGFPHIQSVFLSAFFRGDGALPLDRDLRTPKDRQPKIFLDMIHAVETGGKPAAVARAIIGFFKKRADEESRLIIIPLSVLDQKRVSIPQVMKFIESHVMKSKTGSLLPVLAVYAMYSCVMSTVSLYRDKKLRPLLAHNSADAQSGATGDIEVYNSTETAVFEAVEIKHKKPIDEALVRHIIKKIEDSQKGPQRYFVLSTHEEINILPIVALVNDFKSRTGCELIVNGVFGTIKYYLRMLEQPIEFVMKYSELVRGSKTIPLDQKQSLVADYNEIIRQK